jgi:hypothetical protein
MFSSYTANLLWPDHVHDYSSKEEDEVWSQEECGILMQAMCPG